MAVTSLEEIKQSIFKEEELPGWSEETFTAKLKRVSLVGLAGKGKIPNTLLGTAQSLFMGKTNEKTDITEMYSVFRAIAEESLIEPTLAELEGIGAELTDDQLIAIFDYSQSGVVDLKKFRNIAEDPNSNNNGEGVQQET